MPHDYLHHDGEPQRLLGDVIPAFLAGGPAAFGVLGPVELLGGIGHGCREGAEMSRTGHTLTAREDQRRGARSPPHNKPGRRSRRPSAHSTSHSALRIGNRLLLPAEKKQLDRGDNGAGTGRHVVGDTRGSGILGVVCLCYPSARD